MMGLDVTIPLHFVLLILTFYTLCIICDEYLVPAVEVFIKQFKVPEEVAAVTLVAFGSAAPELFLNSISAVRHTSDLSLSAILGSGMIAFGLIPPLCFLSIHHEEVFLKLSPILRECAFYIIGLSLFLLAMSDDKISVNEAFCIVSVYFIYVGLVCYMYLTSSNGTNAVAQLKQRLFGGSSPASSTGINNSIKTNNSSSNGLYGRSSSPMHRDSGDIEDIESQSAFSSSSVYGHSDLDHDHDHGSSSSSVRDEVDEESQALLPSPYGHDIPLSLSAKLAASKSTTRTRSRTNSPNSPLPLSLVTPTDRDDVETAVVGSMNTSTLERTAHCISSCIATPIRFVLSKVLPQLHPPPVVVPLIPSPTGAGISMTDYTGGGQLNAPYNSMAVSVTSPVRARSFDSSGANNSNSISNGNYSVIGGYSFSVGSSPRTSMKVTTTPPSSPAGSDIEEVDKAHFVPLWRAVTVLCVSIVCIGVLASCIVSLSEVIIQHMGVDTSTMGATFVALGAEIPDTISSIAMARGGYYDGAIAGAIGSQVINISLGVGLPALFVCFTGDGYLRIGEDQSDSITFLACLLFIVIASYVAVTIPVVLMYTQRILPEFTTVGKAGAVLQISVWCSVYAIFIYNNEI